MVLRHSLNWLKKCLPIKIGTVCLPSPREVKRKSKWSNKLGWLILMFGKVSAQTFGRKGFIHLESLKHLWVCARPCCPVKPVIPFYMWILLKSLKCSCRNAGSMDLGIVSCSFESKYREKELSKEISYDRDIVTSRDISISVTVFSSWQSMSKRKIAPIFFSQAE